MPWPASGLPRCHPGAQASECSHSPQSACTPIMCSNTHHEHGSRQHSQAYNACCFLHCQLLPFSCFYLVLTLPCCSPADGHALSLSCCCRHCRCRHQITATTAAAHAYTHCKPMAKGAYVPCAHDTHLLSEMTLSPSTSTGTVPFGLMARYWGLKLWPLNRSTYFGVYVTFFSASTCNNVWYACTCLHARLARVQCSPGSVRDLINPCWALHTLFPGPSECVFIPRNICRTHTDSWGSLHVIIAPDTPFYHNNLTSAAFIGL